MNPNDASARRGRAGRPSLVLGALAVGGFAASIVVAQPSGRAVPGKPPARTAPTPDVPANPVISTQEWSYAGARGKCITTAHYRIWTTQTQAVIGSRMPVLLETALQHYRVALTGGAPLPAPTEPMDTFVMADRAQWATLTRQLMGERAPMFLQIPKGGFAHGGRSLLWDVGAQGTLTIAAHEGWHQFTQRTFKAPLPAWLEEGVATYMEGYRWEASGPVFSGWANLERFDQLREALANDRLLSLELMLNTTPQALLQVDASADRALVYYAQLWALVHFLNEGEGGKYRAGLRAVLSDASAGRMEQIVAAVSSPEAARRAIRLRTGPAIFTAYFTTDIERADREFRAFVREIVRTGGRDAVAAGRSPIRK